MMGSHKIQHHDEFVFGSSIKFRHEDLNPKKERFASFTKNTNTTQSAESLRKKFDIFRKKIETFSIPKIESSKENNVKNIVEFMPMKNEKKEKEENEILQR